MGSLLVLLVLLIVIPSSSYFKRGGSLLQESLEELNQHIKRRSSSVHKRQLDDNTRAYDLHPHDGYSALYKEEAMLAEKVLLRSIHWAQKMSRGAVKAIRATADTVAGITSAMMKSVGALLNLVSNILFEFSMNLLDYTSTTMPVFLRSPGRAIGNTSKNAAKLLFPLGGACIIGGEVLESMTTGLGQAVEDSFYWIEPLFSVAKNVVRFSLKTNYTGGHDTADSILLKGKVFPNKVVVGDEKETSLGHKSTNSTNSTWNSTNNSHRASNGNGDWLTAAIDYHLELLLSGTANLMTALCFACSLAGNITVIVLNYAIACVSRAIYVYVYTPFCNSADEPSIGGHLLLCMVRTRTRTRTPA